MSTNAEKAYVLFQADVGKEEGVGEWFTVEIEGEAEPAMVADWITRIMYA